jgi:hypothetical protein
VTIAIRPSCGTGWRINKTVSTERRNEIFFQAGLDSKISKQPVGQISWAIAATIDRFDVCSEIVQ